MGKLFATNLTFKNFKWANFNYRRQKKMKQMKYKLFKPNFSFNPPPPPPPPKKQSTCWAPRPLQGDGTQSLWPRQELPDPYHCPTQLILMPFPHLEQPAYSFLPSTRKDMWPTPHATPIEALYIPTNQQVYHKTPLS